MAKITWGGPWTEQKLDAFEKYVKAYLIMMKLQNQNWKKDLNQSGRQRIWTYGFAPGMPTSI